jgi:hypothetical protein
MGFRKADIHKVKRYERDGEWLNVRTELSIGDRHFLQEQGQSLASGDDGELEARSRRRAFQRALFRTVVTDWSGEHVDGKPSVEYYEQLDSEWGEWVDDCMDDALTERRDLLESGKADSTTPETTPESSRAEDKPRSRTTRS